MEGFDDIFIRDLQRQFAQDALYTLNDIEGNLLELERSLTQVTFNELRRHLHTLKGNSKAVGFDELSSLLHSFESLCTADLLPQRIGDAFRLLDLLSETIRAYLRDGDTTVFSKLPRRI